MSYNIIIDRIHMENKKNTLTKKLEIRVSEEMHQSLSDEANIKDVDISKLVRNILVVYTSIPKEDR
jgi:hypothetical protein